MVILTKLFKLRSELLISLRNNWKENILGGSSKQYVGPAFWGIGAAEDIKV